MKFYQGLITLIFSCTVILQVYASHMYGYLTKIRYGESAHGDMFFAGTGYNWGSCCVYCKGKLDSGETFDAVTLSNTGECFCSKNSVRVGNYSRMMSFMKAEYYTPTIAVAGRWAAWVENGICWPPCSYSTVTRTRQCKFPEPMNAGAACPGPSTDSKICLQDCLPYGDSWIQNGYKSLNPGSSYELYLNIPNVMWTESSNTKWETFASIGEDGQSPLSIISGRNELKNSHISSYSLGDYTLESTYQKKDSLAANGAFRDYTTLYATSSSTSSYLTVKDKIIFTMTDNELVSDGRKFHLTSIIKTRSNKYAYVTMYNFTKTESVNDKGVITYQLSHYPYVGHFSPGSIPGLLIAITVDTAYMKQRIKNIVFKCRLPFTSAENVRGNSNLFWMVENHDKLKDIVSLSQDFNNNTFTLMIDYIDPVKLLSMNVVVNYTIKDLKGGYYEYPKRLNSRIYNMHCDCSFCPFENCDSVDRKLSASSKVTAGLPTLSPFFPSDVPFRIKYKNNGTCPSYKDTSGVVPLTSTCKTLLQLKHYQRMEMFDKFGKTHGTNTFLHGSDNAWRFSQDSKDLIYIVPFGTSNCLFAARSKNGSGTAMISKDYGMFQSNNFQNYSEYTANGCSLKESFIKVLKGWSNMDSVVLRSLMNVELKQGTFNFVCNPTGDMGNKKNCFYTKDHGLTWRGMPPLLTCVRFFIPSENALYGQCNRGTKSCKIVYTSNDRFAIYMITEGDYKAQATKIESKPSEVFDGIDLRHDVQNTQSDALLGVNALGLFSRASESSTEWKKVYIWAE